MCTNVYLFAPFHYRNLIHCNASSISRTAVGKSCIWIAKLYSKCKKLKLQRITSLWKLETRHFYPGMYRRIKSYRDVVKTINYVYCTTDSKKTMSSAGKELHSYTTLTSLHNRILTRTTDSLFFFTPSCKNVVLTSPVLVSWYLLYHYTYVSLCRHTASVTSACGIIYDGKIHTVIDTAYYL